MDLDQADRAADEVVRQWNAGAAIAAVCLWWGGAVMHTGLFAGVIIDWSALARLIAVYRARLPFLMLPAGVWGLVSTRWVLAGTSPWLPAERPWLRLAMVLYYCFEISPRVKRLIRLQSTL